MVAFTLVALASATTACTPGSEYEPPVCPIRLPAIAALAIERTGAQAYREPGGPASCSSFRPTSDQIKAFLAKAGSVDPQAADATLDRSPCFASGRVRFADGRVARWRAEQLRVGTLAFPGRAEMLLYCRTCRAKPFRW